MNTKSLITTLSLLLASSFSTTAAPATSLLSVSDSLDRTPIVYPESVETDVKTMQENWYLRNYAEIDHEADSRSSVEVSDDVIIERLSKLPTVIEMPFNSVVRNHIELYANRRKQLVENMLGMSLYYMPIFEEALERHGLPLELKYLAVIESALNPNAVSKAGAAGLWQFMVPTAKGEGLEVNSLVDQRRDPYISSDAAARYLKKLYEIYNDWSLAIAAYNCGPGNVNKALRRVPGDGKKDFWLIYPNLPTETRGYVPAFIAANYIMNYYHEHNISPALARKPIVTDSVHVTDRIHFKQISEVLDIPMEEIRALNPQYRTDLIPGNIHPYSLVLPSLQVYAFIANVDSIKNFEAYKYARQGRVEPGTYRGRDSRGEYVVEITVKTHKVKRNETVASIAEKYDVTEASIRDNNKISRKLKRGQRLRIPIFKRTYLTPEPVATPADTTATNNDSISSAASSKQAKTAIDNSNAKNDQKVNTPSKPKTPKAKTVTHKVRKGESLGKIASKYGVTIKAIRNANNIKGNTIYAGQRLKIPVKPTRR